MPYARSRLPARMELLRRRRQPLLVDLVAGAAGGLFGTWALSRVMQRVYARQPASPDISPQEPATEKLARKVLEPLGVQVQGERKQSLGNAVHWTYGLAWGALYGVLHRRLPRLGRSLGLGFGLGLFLFGDEVMVPALRLAPPPHKVPLPVHLGAMAAHLAYGAIAEGTWRLVRRAVV